MTRGMRIQLYNGLPNLLAEATGSWENSETRLLQCSQAVSNGDEGLKHRKFLL